MILKQRRQQLAASVIEDRYLVMHYIHVTYVYVLGHSMCVHGDVMSQPGSYIYHESYRSW